MLFCFGLDTLLSRPSLTTVVGGMWPKVRGDTLYTAVGLLGANVMPHTFYLHSALVQVPLPALQFCDLSMAFYLQLLFSYISSVGSCTFCTDMFRVSTTEAKKSSGSVTGDCMSREHVGHNWSFCVSSAGQHSYIGGGSHYFPQCGAGGPHAPGCPFTYGAGTGQDRISFPFCVSTF